MDNLTKQDSLELEVANFGPIVEAKIDLRPLTVFVGPSNTGKSYLAILIYALHRFFGRYSDDWIFSSARHWNLPQKTIDDADEWARRVQQTLVDKKGEGEEFIDLPDLIVDKIRSLFDAQGDPLGNEISWCFGIDEVGKLIRKGYRGGARIVFRRHNSNDSAPFEHRLMLKAQRTEFGTTIPAGMPMQIDGRRKNKQVDRLLYMVEEMVSTAPRRGHARDSHARRLLENLIIFALPQLARPLSRPAHYLPSSRTGVMHAHRAVVSSLISNASRAGLRPSAGTPMLSGVLADFLQQLIELVDPPPRRRKPRGDLDKQIEASILSGSVHVESSEGIAYPNFTYQPKGWKESLPLMNTSSMVSELAPVVLYLRHVVQPGETLIIEEPEAHLHPAMQVEFTRQIAALVQVGVRVIVTTHSEWVLEELGNIVRRSELPKARRKDIPKGEFALRSDQVGAWLFKQKMRPRGSVVEKIKLDEETGLYPTDYDDVSLALYNDSVGIFNRIQGSNAE